MSRQWCWRGACVEIWSGPRRQLLSQICRFSGHRAAAQQVADTLETVCLICPESDDRGCTIFTAAQVKLRDPTQLTQVKDTFR